jgi:hypothetical protein
MSSSHTCSGFPYLHGIQEEPEQLLHTHDPVIIVSGVYIHTMLEEQLNSIHMSAA